MILLGIAYWQKGDFREAERTLMSAFQNINKETHPILENSAWMLLGDLYIHQCKFEISKSLFEKLINKTKKMKGIEILRPSLYLGLAKIAFLEKDNGGAYELLEQSMLCGESSSLVDWKYKYYLLLARIYASEALFSLAHDCIIESRKVFIMNPIPDDVSIDDVEQEIYLLEKNTVVTDGKRLTKDNDQHFKRERINKTLSEPLTVRELEVLLLIVSGYSNQEIANRLYLSLNTVKSYNQNIFGKLEVTRRTQAAAKAMQLGLI